MADWAALELNDVHPDPNGGDLLRYNTLGRTGLYVSELCLGTMTFAGVGGNWVHIGKLDQTQVDGVVRAALDAGINFFDTADVYSFGLSEQMLGQAFRNLGVARRDVVVATKVFGAMSDKPNDRGAGRVHIADGIKRSLERMEMDYVDLFQIHGNDPVTPLEETLRALDDLVRQGLVRHVGVSNWQAWRVAKALGISERLGLARIDSLQAYYTIAGRDLEREIVPMMMSEGVGLMVWSPLAGGLLSGKYGRDTDGPEGSRRVAFDFPPVNRDRAWACVDAMREVASNHEGASVARVALAWLLAKPWVSTIIVGAKTTEQLADNIAATGLTLSAEEVARLDQVSELPAEYPGWMLERQAAGRVPQPFVPETA